MKKATGSVSRTFKTIYLETINQFICKRVRIIKDTSSRCPKSLMPIVTVIHFCLNFAITVAKRSFSDNSPTGKRFVFIILLFQQNSKVAFCYINIFRSLTTFSLADTN